jgi:hypothetical protein
MKDEGVKGAVLTIDNFRWRPIFNVTLQPSLSKEKVETLKTES